MCTLQRCEQNCNILILLKQGDVKGYLCHNKNHCSKNSVPVGEKVNVYTNIENLKIPGEIIRIAVPVLFPGNVEDPKQYVLTWLRSKRGIPCNWAGAYFTEYILRSLSNAEHFPERFTTAIHEKYVDVFND